MESLLVGSGTTEVLTAAPPITCFVCEADSILRIPRNALVLITPVMGSAVIIRRTQHEITRRGEVYVSDGRDPLECAVDSRGLAVMFCGEPQAWEGLFSSASQRLRPGLHRNPCTARRLIAIARSHPQEVVSGYRSRAAAWQETLTTFAATIDSAAGEFGGGRNAFWPCRTG